MGKKLLLITGPQGSGNHLWSKVFQHKDVFGWEHKDYWQGHHTEPFAKVWSGELNFSDLPLKEYNVVSISCPYIWKGEDTEPDYDLFLAKAFPVFKDIKIAIISRDKNILEHQEKRVRGKITHQRFTSWYLNPDIFLSTESLMLYGVQYLKNVSDILDWPIDLNGASAAYMQDPNKKYIISAPKQELDDMVKSACEDSKND